MKNNYNDCLTRLLKDEGGYTNNPSDPGGPTNFGITLGDYRKYISPQGTAIDVRNMTVEQAKTIYKSKYWDALDCDNLPSGVDYSVFDYGVNSGLGRPKKALQRFKTKTGIDLINAINDERLAFLQSLGTWPVFGKGWAKRVTGVRAHSIELATKPGIKTSAGAAGGAVIAGGAALAATPHQYWPWIIGGTIAAAVVSFIIYEWYESQHKGIQ
jgi:lysozyme family protein